MRIIIKYSSDVLGNDIFWEGEEKDINNIQNIPAQITAKNAIKLNDNYKYGMWEAVIIK